MNRKHVPVLIVCLLVLLVAIAGIGTHLVVKYTPTRKMMDRYEYYGTPASDEAVIIMGTNQLEASALKYGDDVYLPVDVVNTYLNQRFYWDGEGEQILYATPSELLRTPAGEVGTEVVMKDGQAYLNLSYIKKYTDIDTYVYESPARVAVQYDFENRNMVRVTSNTKLRYRGGIKSEVLTDVASGQYLYLLEELEEWNQVATADGYVGYVEKKKLAAPEIITTGRDFYTEPYQYLKVDGKVNLAWHQVTNYDANDYLYDYVANVSGLNVISPTWFTMTDNYGNIKSIASSSYVEEAHSMGMQVWGLIDNFSSEMSTTVVLSSTSSRENLIRNLMDAALEVGLDGINIDFEYLKEEVGPHFLQFLRELSIECHKHGMILSVDNPVPEDFTSHYDRAEQGRVVDYIIIMGYDEHYVGSETAGSVASLPWVEKGVVDTLEEVPAERVINGMPFYTRLWKTNSGIVTSEAIGMDQAKDNVERNHAEVYWNTEVCQNYGSYELEDGFYQIWLEDGDSIAAKVQLVPKYGLAGVAAWKLGFENSSIWSVIQNNLY
ncbi:MAG: glycosyl hydrolase family 18 [Clostridiales bacterium]|nr:glycosyl hydrolase family 18 [Candidatus Blautia equi]